MPFNLLKDFPKNVRDEFSRREKDYGVNLSNDIKDFKGARTHWIRIASGVVTKRKFDDPDDGDSGPNLIESRGLVLEPNLKNYKNYYGMGDERQFIARDVLGKPIEHLNPRKQPGPIVENVTVESKGDMGLTRTGQFTIKAFTQEQFDILTDFFCIAGTTVVLEWGWHTFFSSENNIDGMLDLTDFEYVRDIGSGKSFQKIFNEQSAEFALTTQFGFVPNLTSLIVSNKTRELYDKLNQKVGNSALYYTPYEALMELGNNDYDLFIGTVTNYDIAIEDGTYNITVNLYTIGESFLNMTNNETGLNRYFKNSQDSEFRKFLIENENTDPRIFIKNEVDKTKAKVSSTTTVKSLETEVPKNIYEDDERRRIADLAKVFFEVEPLYFGIRSTEEAIKSSVFQYRRVQDVFSNVRVLPFQWKAAFSSEIVKYMYVSDKHLKELLTRNAWLVADAQNFLPIPVDSAGEMILEDILSVFGVDETWRAYRKFLYFCYTAANVLSRSTSNPLIIEILSNQSNAKLNGSTLDYPEYVFDGFGYSTKGQYSKVGIKELWDTPLFMDVVRYCLEYTLRQRSNVMSGFINDFTSADGFSAEQITQLNEFISTIGSFNLERLTNDIVSDTKIIRRNLYLTFGITLNQALASARRYIISALNPFVEKTTAIPISRYIPNSLEDEDILEPNWGEDDISYILSALRIQKYAYSGTKIAELEADGNFNSGIQFDGGFITNDENINKEESSYAYITYGLLEELLNNQIVKTNSQFSILNSRETKLWYHRNMISSDKNSCIFPNSSAPAYNVENVNEKLPTDALRYDLSINGINERSYPGITDVPNFEIKKPTAEVPEGEALLYSIFVNVELIERVFSSAVDIYDSLMEVLGYINGALGRIYEFKIERTSNSIQIIELTNPNKFVATGDYIFPYNTNRSFIKELDISLSLPDQIAIQALLGEDSPDGKTSNLFTDSVIVGDLYGIPRSTSEIDDSSLKDQKEPVSLIRCFREYQYQSDGSFKPKKHTGDLANYVYPHQPTIDLNTEISAENETFPLPNSEISITVDGISGIHFFNVFNVAFVPRRFRQIGRFFVKGLSHTITPDGWDTSIEGQYMIAPRRYWNRDGVLETRPDSQNSFYEKWTSNISSNSSNIAL